MTYRSDHDAALHRLDTLERELAELKAHEPAEVVSTSPPPRPSRIWLALGMVGWLAAVGVGAWKVVSTIGDGPASAEADTIPSSSDRAQLRACAEATVTLAPCRPLLHLHDSLDLSHDERGLVAMWARIEDALALGVPPARYDALIDARSAVLHDLAL
jgi:hypothetical protein